MQRHAVTLVVLFVSAAVLAAACTRSAPPPQGGDAPSSPVPLDAPPADVPPDGVRPLMWSLAADVRALTLGLAEESPDLVAPQEEIVRRLEHMRGVAQELGALPSHAHPMLAEGLPGFIENLDAAIAGARGTPVDNAMAKNVTATCLNCHSLKPCAHDSYEKCVDVPLY